MKRQQKLSITDDQQLRDVTTVGTKRRQSRQIVEAKGRTERFVLFTAGWDEGEALVLAPFSLAVADVEVDVDRSGQPLVPVGGNLDQEAVLQRRRVTR